MRALQDLAADLEHLPTVALRGEARTAVGMTLEVAGLRRALAIGDRCAVETADGRELPCETIGFRNGRSLVMAFGGTEGVAEGDAARIDDAVSAPRPGPGWLGRVVDALGRPIDGKGALVDGPVARSLRASPPPARARRRVGKRIDTMVRAVDVFTPICRGQRMGIFAGSGVGKSTLLSMFAKRAMTDVVVVGLVGERGREVNEFLEDDLGEEGLARSVVVVATSDESPLMRRQAALMTMAVAESFRDAGAHVLCVIDSVTRFAMAQREIGLAAGEPPTTKSYPPSVFAELPRLLERAGPGVEGSGDITGVFTVLVDGDDHDEPIADAVRGILDGHIVLDRRIAEGGRYPAINTLRSVSRSLPRCHDARENDIMGRARRRAAVYDDVRELVRIGAFKRGSDAEVDRAVDLHPDLESFLRQAEDEATTALEAFQRLDAILAAHGVPS